jgi:rSAM/selenodomain-associated transferase 1
MPRTSPDSQVLVFAKAPEPGKVKTRLIARLGAEGAAALHARLVERTLAVARKAAIGPVTLWCAPDAADPFLLACAGRYGAALEVQAPGDLGTRMAGAFEHALAAAPAAIMVGTDCPALIAAHLQLARDALAQGEDAVFAPAEDGGYVLVGLARFDARVFDGIPWSTGQVMEATRRRLRGMEWRWRELETLWDVDRPADYERLLSSGELDKAPAEPR